MFSNIYMGLRMSLSCLLVKLTFWKFIPIIFTNTPPNDLNKFICINIKANNFPENQIQCFGKIGKMYKNMFLNHVFLQLVFPVKYCRESFNQLFPSTNTLHVNSWKYQMSLACQSYISSAWISYHGRIQVYTLTCSWPT